MVATSLHHLLDWRWSALSFWFESSNRFFQQILLDNFLFPIDYNSGCCCSRISYTRLLRWLLLVALAVCTGMNQGLMQMVVNPMWLPRSHQWEVVLLDLLLLLDFVSKTLLFLELLTLNFENSGMGPTAQRLSSCSSGCLNRFIRSLYKLIILWSPAQTCFYKSTFFGREVILMHQVRWRAIVVDVVICRKLCLLLSWRGRSLDYHQRLLWLVSWQLCLALVKQLRARRDKSRPSTRAAQTAVAIELIVFVFLWATNFV